MKIVDQKRASGKTIRLAQWASTASWTSGPVPTRVLLVPSVATVDYVSHLTGDAVRAITPGQLTQLRGLSNVEIGIDELDAVVNQLVGYPVVVATRTGDQHK